MSRFAESPVPYLLLGLVAESILLIAYLQTRRVLFVVLMAITALLTVAGIFIERAWVTDREALEQAVYGLAEAIEADDVQGVLGFISPQAREARADAKREMGQYEIELARVVSPLEIEFFEHTSPPTARVAFRAIVRVQDGRSGVTMPASLEFILTFTKEGDRWLLLGYAYQIVR
jgi:hypothetical protein